MAGEAGTAAVAVVVTTIGAKGTYWKSATLLQDFSFWISVATLVFTLYIEVRHRSVDVFSLRIDPKFSITSTRLYFMNKVT
jgi:hypothetical protein